MRSVTSARAKPSSSALPRSASTALSASSRASTSRPIRPPHGPLRGGPAQEPPGTQPLFARARVLGRLQEDWRQVRPRRTHRGHLQVPAQEDDAARLRRHYRIQFRTAQGQFLHGILRDPRGSRRSRVVHTREVPEPRDNSTGLGIAHDGHRVLCRRAAHVDRNPRRIHRAHLRRSQAAPAVHRRQEQVIPEIDKQH